MTFVSEPPSAYDLLSKPTLELTDDEAEIIVADLRAKRAAFVRTGKVDKPKAEKAAKVKLGSDEKARNTAALLAQLKLPGAQ